MKHLIGSLFTAIFMITCPYNVWGQDAVAEDETLYDTDGYEFNDYADYSNNYSQVFSVPSTESQNEAAKIEEALASQDVALATQKQEEADTLNELSVKDIQSRQRKFGFDVDPSELGDDGIVIKLSRARK